MNQNINFKEIIKKASRKNFDKGTTKETLLLEYNGNLYVLRNFKDKNKVDRYIKIFNKLKKHNFLPKPLFREGKKLIVEFIEGKHPVKGQNEIDVVGDVSKICAYINDVDFDEKYDMDKEFLSNLRVIKEEKIVNTYQAGNIKKYYLDVKKRFKPKISWELDDSHQDNFIISKDGLFMVDCGAINPGPQGISIAVSFNRWFRTEKQKEIFRREYSKIRSIKYLTEEYLDFLRFYHFLADIVAKIKEKREFRENRLRYILDISSNTK
jgi:hypothetical protein